MSEASEYRGITYAVPNNDDGAWRWVIYPKKKIKGLAEQNTCPRPAYATRDAANRAAKLAIDAVLDRKSN